MVQNVPKSDWPCLALLGGPPAVSLDQNAAHRWPVITAEDEEAVLEVLRRGDLSCDPVTRDLEDDYRRYLGVPYALAHCNGTAGLLAAFFALDLEPGSEVLVPSATFWASVLPMVWTGLRPVFCESEEVRLGLDPDDVARKIGPRTKAMVVVHLWGMPSRMTELLGLARRHGLKVIEDASHALGATWHGRKCGTLGDISVISLQTQKLAPAGEGGIFLTSDERYYRRALMLGDMMRLVERGPQDPLFRFAGTTFGVKTRLSPLNAAVARVQLRHLDERNARRNANIEFLSKRLEPLGFETFLPPGHIRRTYFEFLIRADESRLKLPLKRLIEALRAEGCLAEQPRYPLLHQQPFFTEGHYLRIGRYPPDGYAPPQDVHGALLKTEALSGRLLKLPSFPNAERALLEQYVQAFVKVVHSSELRATDG